MEVAKDQIWISRGNLPALRGENFSASGYLSGLPRINCRKETEPVRGRILFTGKLDKEDKRVLMVKLDNGRVGFGEVSGVVQKCLTDAQASEGSVIWYPAPMKEFKPADNKFEYIISASLLGFNNNGEEQRG